MNDNNLRLDGNAAGGLLNESFQFEMTKAETTGGGCTTKRAIGELTLNGTSWAQFCAASTATRRCCGSLTLPLVTGLT